MKITIMESSERTRLYGQVVGAVFQDGVYKATKYVSPTYVIKATRHRYNGRLVRHNLTETILFTAGRPNYLERKFIKACQKAGEPFPVRRIQLKFVEECR